MKDKNGLTCYMCSYSWVKGGESGVSRTTFKHSGDYPWVVDMDRVIATMERVDSACLLSYQKIPKDVYESLNEE